MPSDGGIMMRVFRGLRWVAKYISDLVAWLKTAPLIAIFASVIVVTLCIVFVPCLERKIRFSGWGLQLLGVVVAGIGLRDTRRAFEDQPTTWEAIKLFFSKRPTFGPKNYGLQPTGVAVGISIGSPRLRVSAGPNPSLEQRVAILEKQYVALFDEVGTLTAETRKKTDEISSSQEAERAERQEADIRATEQMKRAIAEGIPLAGVGVVFFLIGITAGTISLEIASIFGAGACQ